MYQNTITLFNFHKKTGVWYPSVISGVDLIASKANNATKEGTVNGDTVEIIIHCNKEKAVETSEGLKSYTGAKAYEDGTVAWAYREKVWVVPNTIGGDTSGVQIPFAIYNAGERVKGTFDLATKTFTPAEG